MNLIDSALYLCFREDSHYTDIIGSVAGVVNDITTWSGFNNYRVKNGEAAAQEMLGEIQDT